MYLDNKFVTGFFSGSDVEYSAIRKMVANRERRCSVNIRAELLAAQVKLAKTQVFWLMMAILFVAVAVTMVGTYSLNKTSMISDITSLALSAMASVFLAALSFGHMMEIIDGPDNSAHVKLSESSESGKIFADYRELCSIRHPGDLFEVTFDTLSHRAKSICLVLIKQILATERDLDKGYGGPEDEYGLLKSKDKLNAFHQRHATYGLLPNDLGILFVLARKEGLEGETDFQI